MKTQPLNGSVDRELAVKPPPCQAVPAAQAFRILARDAWTNLRLLARQRQRRDRERVDAEYNSGTWKRTLEDKRWLQCRDPYEYVAYPNDEQVMVAKVQGRLVRVRCCDYYDYRLRLLQEVLRAHADGEPELVELGCGSGFNLFSLALADRWPRLTGFDISENAVHAAREAARHFRLSDISFGILDLTDGAAAPFAQLRGKVVFTHYCLEQLKYATAKVIDNLLRAGVRRVVHIEPTYELLRPWSLMDWVSYLYVRKRDFQDNLLKTLSAYVRQGRVRIRDVRRLYYNPSHRNDPTLICWEPAAGEGATSQG
jgi:SAM-dependent methyltransferase